MALQVWLPLNGNLENKGLSNYVFSNKEATISDTGKIGQSYLFNGTSSVIYNNNIAPIGNKWTIGGWFLFNTIGETTQYAISFSNDGKGGTAAHQLGIGVYTSTAAIWVNGTVYTLTHDDIVVNSWVHIMMAFDGQTAFIYVNGELTRTIDDADTVVGKFLTLGARSNSTSGAGSAASYYFQGQLNDIRLYDECLSAKMIKEISKGLVAHYKLSGDGGVNLLPLGGLTKNGATSVTYDKYTDTYTIVSPVGTTTWGYGVNVNQSLKVIIPYGATYRFSAEVYVPTAHTLKFDYNNTSADSTTLANWGGNDNDNTGTRLASSFSIPANQWTRIVAGSSNTATGNTAGVGIIDYSLLGLYTANDTESVTWYVRHPKIELGNVDTAWSPGGFGYLVQESDLSGLGYTLDFSTLKPHGVGVYARYTGSYQFHGKNTQYLYRDRFDWLEPPFTFNCWCNQASRTSEKGSAETTTLQFVESQGRDCGLAGFSLALANGVPRLYLGTETDGTYHQINSDTTLTLNTWHMLTGTYDGITVKLYVDGVLKASKAVTTAIDWSQATGFTIGKMAYLHTTTTNYFPFNGYINDVRIYATALSEKDVLNLYQKSAYIDNKGFVGAYEFIEEE